MRKHSFTAVLLAVLAVVATLGLTASPAAASPVPTDLSLSIYGVTSAPGKLTFQYVVSNYGPGDTPPSTFTDGRAYTLEIEIPSGAICNGSARFFCTEAGVYWTRVRANTGWLHTIIITGQVVQPAKIYLFLHPHSGAVDPNYGNNSRNFSLGGL